MSTRRKNILLISEDLDRMERWSTFLKNFDLNVMLAPNVDVGQQFFASVPIDVAMVDSTCSLVSESLRRNQSDVFVIHVVERTSESGGADFTMLHPVDLFVLEDVLVKRAEVVRDTQTVQNKAGRERERAARQ